MHIAKIIFGLTIYFKMSHEAMGTMQQIELKRKQGPTYVQLYI